MSLYPNVAARLAHGVVMTLLLVPVLAMASPRITTSQVNSVFKNRYVELQNNDVVFPNGKTGKYLRLLEGNSPKAGSAVLAIDPTGRVLLVESFRYGVDAIQWELPRGGSNKGESFVQTGLRELQEETGLSKEAVLKASLLGTVHPNSAILASEVGLVLVRIKAGTVLRAGDGEVQGKAWVPMSTLWKRVAQGEIKDGFTLSALALLKAKMTTTEASQ